MWADKCAALEAVCSVTTQKLQWDKSGLWSPLLVEVSQTQPLQRLVFIPALAAAAAAGRDWEVFHVINSSSELQRVHSPLACSPRSSSPGFVQMSHLKWLRRISRGRQKAVMVLWNSSFNKAKLKGVLVLRITHRRMVWLARERRGGH